MEVSSKRRILWIDDDGPQGSDLGRFPYQSERLQQAGWDVVWANSAREGAIKLRDEVFDVVFLDQMLPWRVNESHVEVWAGCLLLSWLRRRVRPKSAPPMSDFDELQAIAPHSENKEVPVVLITAFNDDEIACAFQEVDPDLDEIYKPVDVRDLLWRLEHSLPKGRGRQ